MASATRLRWPRLSRCGIRRSNPAHPDRGQRALDAVVDLGFGEAHVERPERHVVEHGRAEELVVGVLEDEADLGPDPPRPWTRSTFIPPIGTRAVATARGCR